MQCRWSPTLRKLPQGLRAAVAQLAGSGSRPLRCSSCWACRRISAGARRPWSRSRASRCRSGAARSRRPSRPAARPSRPARSSSTSGPAARSRMSTSSSATSVTVGQAIAALDPAPFQLKIENAQSSVAQAADQGPAASATAPPGGDRGRAGVVRGRPDQVPGSRERADRRRHPGGAVLAGSAIVEPDVGPGEARPADGRAEGRRGRRRAAARSSRPGLSWSRPRRSWPT